jgi:hypothetical protein
LPSRRLLPQGIDKTSTHNILRYQLQLLLGDSFFPKGIPQKVNVRRLGLHAESSDLVTVAGLTSGDEGPGIKGRGPAVEDLGLAHTLMPNLLASEMVSKLHRPNPAPSSTTRNSRTAPPVAPAMQLTVHCEGPESA